MSLPDDIQKRRLVYAAGLLYALSLHKYVSRDPLSQQAGAQGILEFGLMVSALACVCLAARGATRRYDVAPAFLCFATFGVFALASSWRSFNPSLSFAKGLLLFVVLLMSYLASQLGLIIPLLQSTYWTYLGSLVVGLILGLVMPSHFPLWAVDEFTGRSRLAVFGTFPGTMGETAAYLILLAPILFQRPHWIASAFLLLLNFAAGGKTSTGALLLLLGVEYLIKMRRGPSWRPALLLFSFCTLILAVLIFTWSGNTGITESLSHSLSAIYGHDVSSEAVSLDGRLDLWRGSISLIAQSPALGFGFDGARVILLKIAVWSGSSHNGFLELGLAGGGIALGFFVVGFLGVLRACARSHPPFRSRSLLVLAYMTIIGLTGVTFNFPSYFGLLILTALLFLSQPVLRPGVLRTFQAASRQTLNFSRERH